MSGPGTPTLDQLHVLLAVAEAGSFSAAARRLNRAQSVVSYAIANLEAQLGLTLFDRATSRPALTEAGRAVLADARQIALSVQELRARAAGLQRGLESEVSVVVDVMFPGGRLAAALRDFARAFPTVGLRLRVEGLGAAIEAVLEGISGIGVSGPIGTHPALTRRRIGGVRLVPVAAPDHPLAQLSRPLAAADLRAHVQLVLTDRSRLTEGQDFAVHSPRTWRLGDLGAKHMLLCAGLGWGNMPAPMVAGDIETGRLRVLALAEGEQPLYPLILIHRTDAPPGPAASHLAALLAGGTDGAPVDQNGSNMSSSC
jgi:DNA-binding transcriptional LysR family regulator